MRLLDRETERDRERDRHRERQREKETQRERETERGRERERQRERGTERERSQLKQFKNRLEGDREFASSIRFQTGGYLIYSVSKRFITIP